MKPILFSTPMVQAILDGRKTMTRRVMTPQPLFKTHRKFVFADETCPKKWEDCDDITKTYKYQPGDILWVRETWRAAGVIAEPYAYKANETELNLIGENGQLLTLRYKWRPSIHMPREAARIFLRVTDVWVERLQDITEEEVAKEGTRDCDNYITPKGPSVAPWHIACFETLWNSTLKEKQTGPLSPYRFCFNPWVWVISFERCEKPEAADA